MRRGHRSPPLLGRALLNLLQPRRRRAEIESDLSELFERRLRDRGAGYASWRYCADVLSLWRCRHRAEQDEPVWMAFHLRDVSDDVRFAVRMFCRQPGTVGATVAGLALAIGMGTAVFTVLNAVALRGAGIADRASVYRVAVDDLVMPPLTGNRSSTRGDWAAQDYAVLEQTARSMRVAAASYPAEMAFRTTGEPDRPELMFVVPVSGGYFAVLGVSARLGRTLAPSDDAAGAAPAVVISHTFWKNRLAEDPAIVGRTVWLDEMPFTVVGVAQRAFSGGRTPEPPAGWLTFASHAAMWARRQSYRMDTNRARVQQLAAQENPTTLQRSRLEALRSEMATVPRRWNQPVAVLARLDVGVSPEQARAEATAIARGLASERGESDDRAPSVRLTPADDDRSVERLTAIAITMAVIALLVFLACSNVANLLLANAAGRRREIGTRLALGASRARIVRQLFTESVLLGAAAGASGLVLSVWLAPLLGRALHLPPLLDLEPDLRVYTFTAGITGLAGVLAGLAPARFGRRGDLLGALQADRTSAPSTMAPNRLRTILIGAQATGSTVLLVVAALFARSLGQAMSFDLGFDPDRLVSVSIGFGRGYDAPRTATYWDAALDRVRQMPDCAGAALAAIAPFGDGYAPDRPAGGTGPHRYLLRNEVSAEFFQTAGIRVLRGRTFNRDEVRGQSPVAVISAELARSYWKDEEPLGSTLDRVWGHRGVPEARGLVRKPAGTRIIGVVADTITRFRKLRCTGHLSSAELRDGRGGAHDRVHAGRSRACGAANRGGAFRAGSGPPPHHGPRARRRQTGAGIARRRRRHHRHPEHHCRRARCDWHLWRYGIRRWTASSRNQRADGARCDRPGDCGDAPSRRPSSGVRGDAERAGAGRARRAGHPARAIRCGRARPDRHRCIRSDPVHRRDCGRLDPGPPGRPHQPGRDVEGGVRARRPSR
jgi:predicted permease